MLGIREVTRADMSAWSAMRTALWPDTQDGHLAEIEEYFSGDSMNIESVFVAEVDGELVGFMELNIRTFVEGSSQPAVPYIEAWYVQPGYQHKGHGRQLMHHAEQWALSLGYSELASDSEIGNERSIALHTQLGFRETERVVCFLKSLKED